MGDNFQFNLSSEGIRHFHLIMEIAFSHHSKATHYYITEDNTMVLLWTGCTSHSYPVKELPYPMLLEQAVNFVWGWLENVSYGPEPDHDGSNGKGFTVFNESWGHVHGLWQAFVAIQPAWMMYGK